MNLVSSPALHQTQCGASVAFFFSSRLMLLGLEGVGDHGVAARLASISLAWTATMLGFWKST
jgi:hypothetical protein